MAPQSAESTEVELKLTLDPKAARSAAHVAVLQRLGVQEPTRHALRSLYFDTPKAHLRRSHLTLRLRRARRAWWQALEQEDAAAAGLHVRAKSELPVAAGGLDLEKIENERLRRKLHKWQIAGDLMPRFETVINRTTWLLNTGEGGVVECAIDHGKVRTLDGHADAPLCEVELEVKSGPVSELFAVARELATCLPLAKSSYFIPSTTPSSVVLSASNFIPRTLYEAGSTTAEYQGLRIGRVEWVVRRFPPMSERLFCPDFNTTRHTSLDQVTLIALR